LADNIIKKAGIGAFAGEMITKLDDMQLLVPRGKYSFNMYSNYLKIHGKTHDYKILYKDINRAFMLPKPDGVHMIYIVSLKAPLRQGQTAHHYLVMQMKRDREEKLVLNMSPKEIKDKYDDQLTQELEGPLYDILSRLLKAMTNITIIIPSGFKSVKDTEAIKCSVRAQDGYLYPLQKSFLFIHKPVAYMRHDDILHLEFSRISEFTAAGRSFDINIISKKSGTMSFTGIDKQEYKPIIEYLKTKKLKIRNADEEGKIMDLENNDYTVEKKSRRAAQLEQVDDEQQALDLEDSDEEDEDFDVAVQEQEDSEFEESNGSESLIEESDSDSKKKKSKGKSKSDKKVKEEEAKD
jgi:structure-specific recognition protein 1